MLKFFNFDGPLMVFLTKVANLALLNILWILCSIPIFTMGAATSALHYSTIRMTNGYDDRIVKNYFAAFKKNFKKSTIIWLILLVAGGLLSFDIYFFYKAGLQALIYISLPLIAIFAFILLYIFAIEAIFDNSIKNAFRNACVLSVFNIPSTLLMFVGIVFVGKITFFSVGFFISYGFLFWLIVGFGFISYMTAFFFDRIFKKSFSESEYEDILHIVSEL